MIAEQIKKEHETRETHRQNQQIGLNTKNKNKKYTK